MAQQILDAFSDSRKEAQTTFLTKTGHRAIVEIVEFPTADDLMKQGYLQVIDRLRRGTAYSSVMTRGVIDALVSSRVPVVRR